MRTVKRAFTLVEMLVVFAILAILFCGYSYYNKQDVINANLAVVKSDFMNYFKYLQELSVITSASGITDTECPFLYVDYNEADDVNNVVALYNAVLPNELKFDISTCKYSTEDTGEYPGGIKKYTYESVETNIVGYKYELTVSSYDIDKVDLEISTDNDYDIAQTYDTNSIQEYTDVDRSDTDNKILFLMFKGVIEK